MELFINQALKDINDNIHKNGIIEILDEGRFYYKFMFLEHETDHNKNMIIKLIELSDTEFREDNKVYRFSLEELREGRAYFLIREEKKKEKDKKLFSNLKVC